MKFSKKLQHYVNQQYSQHYLSYKDLKKAIKLITGSDTSSYTINEVTSNFGNIKALAGSIYRPAESRFMDLLNHELDKINSFSSIMYTNIKDSLKQIQGYIDQISKDLGISNNSSNNSNTNDCDSSFFQAGMSKELLDDLISPLVEQLERRSGEIIFLESYQQLNYTGFRKITKKYDKMNKSTSSSWYLARLARESFMNMNLDLLLESLSSCYAKIEELKNNFLMKEESLKYDAGLEKETSIQPPFEIHSKHLILAEDVMKVKVLLAKIVPLVSVGLLNVEESINKSYLFTPTNNTNSQKTSSENVSSLALQTSTVSYMYFDNREFSEYHRIREIRSRFCSCSSQSNTQIEENTSGRIQAYSDEKIAPKKYLDYTFRLRWYGENEGSPDQWLNLDWIHPMEPSCSITEWHDPKNNNFVHQTVSSDQTNQVGSLFSFEGSKAFVSSKTLLIQQKDVFHILKTFGDLRRESKNPLLSSNFDLNTYLNETRRNLSQDQIMLLNCFIEFIQFRKLGPFSHLWFHRTTFASPRRNICIHIDNNLKIMPEINSELLIDEHFQGNGSSMNNLPVQSDRNSSSDKSGSNYEIANTELGTNSIFNMRPSILYNTFIVSPQTEALVSENMKAISHGILSVSVSNDTGNLQNSTKNLSKNLNPRDILKDILGLASVSEVIGFSNIETCTALLFSNNLLQVPHWFNFMAIESESQQEITNNIKDSNSESQALQTLNRSVSLNKEMTGNKQLQSFEPEKSSFNNSMPKIDVLHTGKNARILHDQEVTAQREASILTNEIQTNSLSSLNSTQTLSNMHPLKNLPIKKNEIKRECTQEKSGNKDINNNQKKCVSSAVRVEPKTFFANERTLLQWMNMSVLLATISVSLLSFGTQVGHICGLIMAPVAIFFIAYSYYIYLKRNKALETKEPISYNDKFGPTLLVMCLIISLTSVLLLNIIVGGNKQHFKDIHDYYREDYVHYYQNQQNENHLLAQSNHNQSSSNGNYLYH
ncbi:G-protein associated signal transduction protein [Cryptosporidium ubiquitum]|uniref:G-protein associated signal transduction protein n=1 Tax=Cryptosporidium ubiquitum TaxID=857276 RepID=A0A1J4MG75_9CRYT|nr:G-protein associated signal transduction protein [Cryptosporidium ubiquitum]OII73230.1 G-protein associated signal transduction protein [Cryptosporidium ubiquitum]